MRRNLHPASWSRVAGDALLSVLLAPSCVVCGDLLGTPLEGPVCGSCWSSIRLITPPICQRCGGPLASWQSISQESARCARCRRGSPSVDRGCAIGEYEGSLRSILHAFKYQRHRSLGARLGRLMRMHGRELLMDADLVVPVPLHSLRLMARGFNQAEDLSRQVGLPVARVLKRTRRTPPQVSLPSSRRHRNVRDAFALRRTLWMRLSGRPPRVAGRIVVLVDDVSTTGATLEACARVLKAAGAREVRALTAARAVWRPPHGPGSRPRSDSALRQSSPSRARQPDDGSCP